jgi:hypothetical protein
MTCQRLGPPATDGSVGWETGPTPDGSPDGAIPDQPLPPIDPWFSAFGDEGSDLAIDLTLGADGGTCICGSFNGQLDLGDGPMAAQAQENARDLLVACFDAEGTLGWARRYGSAESTVTGQVIVAGPDSTLYVSGTYRGTLDLGVGAVSSADAGLFLAAFDPDGTPRWVEHLGRGGSSIQLYAMAVGGPEDTCYLAGSFYDSIDLGQGEITADTGADVFLTSYTRGQSDRWRKTFGAGGTDIGRAVAVDAQGSVHLAGYFEETVDFGGKSRTAQDARDIFLATFAPDGALTRVRRLGLDDNQYAYALAADDSGNLYLTGQFAGVIELAGTQHTATDAVDGYLLALDSAGEERWAKTFPGPGVVRPRELTTSSDGAVYLAGEFEETITVDGELLSHSSNIGFFVAGFSTDGAKLTALGFSSAEAVIPEGLAVDDRGDLLLTGNFKSGVDLGIGAALAKGEAWDFFLARLALDDSK